MHAAEPLTAVSVTAVSPTTAAAVTNIGDYSRSNSSHVAYEPQIEGGGYCKQTSTSFNPPTTHRIATAWIKGGEVQ